LWGGLTRQSVNKGNRMESQVVWGVALIALGVVILVLVRNTAIRIIYGVPLIIIGVALICFKGREDVIEEIEVKT